MNKIYPSADEALKGVVKDGQLHVMYTGNVRTEKWERVPNQIVARMEAGDTSVSYFSGKSARKVLGLEAAA